MKKMTVLEQYFAKWNLVPKWATFWRAKKVTKTPWNFEKEKKKMIRFDENFDCYYFFLFVLCHMNQQRLISYALVNTIIFTWKHFQKWHTVIKVSKSYLENISFKPTKKIDIFVAIFPLLNDCSLYFWRIKKCVAYHYFWDNDYLLKNFISQSIWRKKNS